MRSFALTLVLFAAAPVAAQDRVRLDDFALPTDEQSVGVEQLTEAKPLPPEQVRDRSLAVPGLPDPPSAPIGQLSSEDKSSAQSQLTGREASRRIAPATVSSAADSKPQSVQRIGGRDRCDPQALEGAERAECLRILELRAAEFHATEAPQLSAEQKLLTEQQREDDRFAPSNALRLRLASSDDPDAELSTNQEIAAIYLDRGDVAASLPPSEAEADPGIPTGDLIEALQAALPGITQP